MQKLLSILLLALLGLPFASLLLTSSAKQSASLPVCCLKSGRHHCMANTAQHAQLAAQEKRFATPVEKCPYCPKALVSAHRDLSAAPIAGAIFAALVSHPAGSAQVASRWRIARDRSRQKRGPPYLS